MEEKHKCGLPRPTQKMKCEVFLPRDVIVKAGTLDNCMYFIVCGTVSVTTSTGTEICHLSDGDYFGEVSLVTFKERRTLTMVAVEITEIDLKHINQKFGDNKVEFGIDLREYYPSVEWDILGVPAERHEKYYPCCAEPYPDIFFNITLRRKTLFYTVNLIVPCVGISYLSVLVFYLPADSGEKIALCISILLSQTMFFLLISEIIPSTSLALPLLGKYLLFTMLLVGLSVVITIMVLNVHYRKPSTHKMAPWVRKVFIRRLPKLLFMKVPEQLLQDLAANKKFLKANKSRLNAAAVAAAAASSSVASSPDSLRHFHQRPGGCNGLHSSTSTGVTNRFGGLVGGFNGLPAVVGLDGSLSDVGVGKKKYPFELEKAIHNVMFIQHHMQRQDEFDAEDQDWGFVAMVLDRLFLWIFTIASIVGTFAILCEAPALYDDTKPIDMELSSVARQQWLPEIEVQREIDF
uniref:Cyclic nucleotide-binding domain-containing protein n=1 Tax=Timema monikensis TaxID=170555 RepID=A0A7R9EEB4_9NEOP|nr:unnamed protein product [Timema monikensis]